MDDGPRTGVGPFSDSFWARLDHEERALLRRAGVVQRFGPGESLSRQGDLQRHVYVLLAGSVEIVTDASTGYEAVLALRGEGDLVGEFAAVDEKPRSATMRALDRIEAVVIPAERFAALCQSNTRVAWAVLTVVVGRVREISRKRTEDGARPVTQRLAALLLELGERYGETTPDGVVIALPLTQKSMAGLIAASRESVVRGFSRLRRQNLIRTKARRVTILQQEALRRLASGDPACGE
jgi:CRP/FNR family cyclic AMP-dependent transcriptional regulator